MSKIHEFMQTYNANYNINKTYMEWVMEDFIHGMFNAIDDDLSDLQNDVDSGCYSNQDICDKIQEIRNEL